MMLYTLFKLSPTNILTLNNLADSKHAANTQLINENHVMGEGYHLGLHQTIVMSKEKGKKKRSIRIRGQSAQILGRSLEANTGSPDLLTCSWVESGMERRMNGVNESYNEVAEVHS